MILQAFHYSKFINTGPYLGFECNFRFFQIPYFGHLVTISALNAQPTLVCKLPLQLGPRGSQSVVEHLIKVLKGP